MPSTCRSCGAPIRWVRLPSGKALPIDPVPVPDGTVVVHADGERAAVVSDATMEALAIELGTEGMEAMARLRYRSHFASCPNAASHRKV